MGMNNKEQWSKLFICFIPFMQLEDEIATLRQVLAAKEKHLVEIKQKLGLNLMNELKQNFSKSWHDVQTTTAWVQISFLLSSSYYSI